MTDHSQQPHPPVPADADLRDFPFMPIDINRLFASAFHARASDSEWRAGFTLWLKSFHQVPAGSLPDDDIEVCRLAELGRDVKTWRKVKSIALHGWYRASDGRLYHDVVAEKTAEAWRRKGEQKARTLKARVAALQKRFDDASNQDDKNHIGALLHNLRQDLSQALARAVTEPKKVSDRPKKQPVTETNRQGQGQGQGQGDSKKGLKQPSVSAAEAPPDPEPGDPGPDPGDDQTVSRYGPQAAMINRAEVDAAYALWTPVAYEMGISDVGFLNDDRRAAFSARLAEIGGIDGWKVALEKLRAAEFLFEEDGSPKHWVNLFNLLKPENFTGLMENRYAKRRAHNGAKSSLGTNRQALAEWSREGDR
jgi:hypothetical protein